MPTKCTDPTCAVLRHDCPNCLQRNNQAPIIPVPQTDPNPPHINDVKCKCVICKPQKKGGKKCKILKHDCLCWNCMYGEVCCSYSPILDDGCGHITPQPESEGVEIDWNYIMWEETIALAPIAKQDNKELCLRDILSQPCLQALLDVFRNLLQAQAKQIRREEKFIGLTDKHGKKIYEGDKLRDSKGIGVVTWLDSRGGWAVYVEGEGYYYPHSYGEYQLKDTEIVK